MTGTCAKCERDADGGRGLCVKHWATNRHRLRAYGKWDPEQVDPTSAQEHFAALRAAGMGVRRMEEPTGLARPTLQRVPKVSRLNRKTRDAILAVPIPTTVFDPVLYDGTQISALGSRRRLQALAAIGWDSTELAAQIGVGRHRVTAIAGGRQPKVTAARARQIADLFAQLQLTSGPSERARRIAQSKGWALPLAWDEDSIDDPSSEPIGIRRRECVSIAAQVAELRDMGITSPSDIATRIGAKRKSVDRALLRVAEKQREDIAS